MGFTSVYSSIRLFKGLDRFGEGKHQRRLDRSIYPSIYLKTVIIWQQLLAVLMQEKKINLGFKSSDLI